MLHRLLPVLLLPLASASHAADFQPDKFVQQSCTRCHGSEVYTREDRRVKSLQQLDAQVRRCDSMVGTRLYEDDINLLVDYLNQRYYHF